MAAYAPLRPAVWADEDFRALTPQARLLYLYLISHPKLTRCGLVPFVPDRWAAQLGYPIDQPLADLEAGRYVLVDRDTYEAVVRTKVKHDPPTSWQQCSAAWKAWEQIESPWLGEVVAWEMPEVAWTHERVTPPIARPDTRPDTPCHAVSDTPSDRASDTPSDAGNGDTQSDTQSDTPPRETPTPTPTPTPSSDGYRHADPPDDDEKINQVLNEVARLRAPDKTPKYIAKVVANMRSDEALDVDAARLVHDYPTAPVGLIAARLHGEDARNLAHFRRTTDDPPPPADKAAALAHVRQLRQETA